jgi:hypothetical protein
VRALAGLLAGLTDRRFQPIGNHSVVFHESVRRRLVRTWAPRPKPRPALWATGLNRARRPDGTALRAALYRESGFVLWPIAEAPWPPPGPLSEVDLPRIGCAIERNADAPAYCLEMQGCWPQQSPSAGLAGPKRNEVSCCSLPNLSLVDVSVRRRVLKGTFLPPLDRRATPSIFGKTKYPQKISFSQWLARAEKTHRALAHVNPAGIRSTRTSLSSPPSWRSPPRKLDHNSPQRWR